MLYVYVVDNIVRGTASPEVLRQAGDRACYTGDVSSCYWTRN